MTEKQKRSPIEAVIEEIFNEISDDETYRGRVRPPRFQPASQRKRPARPIHPFSNRMEGDPQEGEEQEPSETPEGDEREADAKSTLKEKPGVKKTKGKGQKGEHKNVKREVAPRLPKPRYHNSHRRTDPDWDQIRDWIDAQEKRESEEKQREENVELLRAYLEKKLADEFHEGNEVIVIFDTRDGTYKVLLKKDDNANTEGNVTTAEQRSTSRMSQFNSNTLGDNLGTVFVCSFNQAEMQRIRAMSQAQKIASQNQSVEAPAMKPPLPKR